MIATTPLPRLGRGPRTADHGQEPPPMADATAISFASPLITVALAAVILKEHVRIYRWTAVLVGFGGVIVMLIPHFDVGHYAAPAPQSRVEENREHPSGDKAPPQPVPRDPAACHHSRDG